MSVQHHKHIVHLSGGIRAISQSGGEITLEPPSLGGTVASIPARYGAIAPDLQALGLQLVGIEFLSNAWEVKGFVPPDWRPYHKRPLTVWPCFEAFTKWRQISHGAFLAQNGRLWDMAGRIAHSIDSCSWRLRRISEAYRTQLLGLLGRKDFKDGQPTMDGYTPLTYSDIESFLVDACTLRDQSAEFVCCFHYGPNNPAAMLVTTAAGLLKTKILDTVSDPISDHLRQITSKGGWLTELGHYRDLVVHSAPLIMAKQGLKAVCASHTLPNSQILPMVRFPLPENPADIRSLRATTKKDNLFADFSKQVDAFIGATATGAPSVDALKYLHSVFGNLLDLSLSLSGYSPIAPQMPKFDHTNIIGPIKYKNIGD